MIRDGMEFVQEYWVNKTRLVFGNTLTAVVMFWVYAIILLALMIISYCSLIYYYCASKNKLPQWQYDKFQASKFLLLAGIAVAVFVVLFLATSIFLPYG